jgi:hypothetical protein
LGTDRAVAVRQVPRRSGRVGRAWDIRADRPEDQREPRGRRRPTPARASPGRREACRRNRRATRLRRPARLPRRPPVRGCSLASPRRAHGETEGERLCLGNPSRSMSAYCVCRRTTPKDAVNGGVESTGTATAGSLCRVRWFATLTGSPTKSSSGRSRRGTSLTMPATTPISIAPAGSLVDTGSASSRPTSRSQRRATTPAPGGVTQVGVRFARRVTLTTTRTPIGAHFVLAAPAEAAEPVETQRSGHGKRGVGPAPSPRMAKLKRRDFPA